MSEISKTEKQQTYEIVIEAMLATHLALNAALVILESSLDDATFYACDEIAQASRHLTRGAHFISKMPTAE